MSQSNSLRQDIEALRKHTTNQAIWQMLFIYGLLGLIFFLFSRLPSFFWLFLIPSMGIVQYYIVISGHEAVHKTLCANIAANEFLGVLGQAMVGVNFHAYRLQHLDHHRCDSYETDPDAHIYMKVMSVSAGWPRFFYLVFGTFIEILIKIRQKGSGGYGTDRDIKPLVAKQMKRDSFFVILAQVGIMGLAFLCLGGLPFSLGLPNWIEVFLGCIWSYSIIWIIPLFCITVFLNRCRIVIEHGLALRLAQKNNDFGGPRIPTVDVVPHPLERIIFAPFLFNYHCAHHLFMAVPHYQLPALHHLLKKHRYDGHHSLSGGYIHSIWTAMKEDS